MQGINDSGPSTRDIDVEHTSNDWSVGRTAPELDRKNSKDEKSEEVSAIDTSITVMKRKRDSRERTHTPGESRTAHESDHVRDVLTSSQTRQPLKQQATLSKPMPNLGSILSERDDAKETDVQRR